MNQLPILIVAAALLTTFSAHADETDLKPYPAADEGFTRWVFRVPNVEDELSRKIEIVVGKITSVDCNRMVYGGNLERRVVEGWGYPYHVIEKISPPLSTRMACPPEYENTDEFVTVAGEGYLQRYNSKLPIVVYVPDGFEVRYRLWEAQQDVAQAAVE